MIDFAALVLGPAMAAFGEPVTLTPPVTPPPRAVFAFKPVEIQLAEGGVHSTNQPALGVRLAEFPVAPRQGDVVTFRGIRYALVDVIPDGQGGADLMLRESPA